MEKIRVHEDGQKVTIRVDEIDYLEPCPWGTEIALYSGESVYADEDYSVVDSMLCEVER